jgi:DNA-binding MarR family transcriptional regulator
MTGLYLDKITTVSAGSESSFRASDVGKQIQRLAARGCSQDLRPPSEWRAIIIKLDEFGQAALRAACSPLCWALHLD